MNSCWSAVSLKRRVLKFPKGSRALRKGLYTQKSATIERNTERARATRQMEVSGVAMGWLAVAGGPRCSPSVAVRDRARAVQLRRAVETGGSWEAILDCSSVSSKSNDVWTEEFAVVTSLFSGSSVLRVLQWA